jgi:hypothetical protein
MNRLGETLSSTHDLPKLLAVLLEAAVQARRAKAGSVLLLTPRPHRPDPRGHPRPRPV